MSDPHGLNHSGLGSRVYGFAFFYVGLHPAEDFRPAAAVVLGGLDVAGESVLADFYQRAGADAMRTLMMQAVDIARLKLASHCGLEFVGEAWVPCVDEEARSVDLQIFAVHAEGFAICTDAGAGPLAAGAKIAAIFGHAIHVLLAPPFRHLLRIG